MTTGTVSSNNLTSLYSNTTSFTAGVVNSSVYSVNGGLGVTVNPITGNVVVAIGQDVATTANVTFANVTATGNLSNNYFTLANSAGTNGQVLTTNGAGVTTWTTPSSLGLVSSVTGSGAGINVSPTTGAVIVSNTGVTSIVAGTNISISGATGAVTINAVGFGTGDVTGPASATDNAIVRFDGTTGKLIQNSNITIADTTGAISTTSGDLILDSATNQVSASSNFTVQDNLTVNNGTVLTNSGNVFLFDTTATTVDAFGAATIVNIGASAGIVNIEGDLRVNNDKTDADVYTYYGRVAPNANAAIRWNKTTNSFEWSADSSTYYDFIPADLTPTFYNGQILSYLNGEWINDNKVTTTDSNERNVFSYRPLTPTAGPNTSLFLRKDYSNAAPGTPGVGTYADGAGTSIGFSVQSDTQAPPGGSAGQQNNYANITGVYSATVPTVSLRTSIDNGATAFTQVANFSTTAATIGGTTLTLDANNAGAANNSSIIANRGSSGTDASLTWTESTGFWVFNEDVFGQGEIIANTTVGTNGQYVTFNNEDTTPVGDCYLLVKRAADPDVNIKWNETTDRWQDTFDGTNYFNLPNQNLDTTDDVSFSSVTVDSQAALDSSTLTTTATTTVALNTTGRNAVTGLINIIQGANVHCLNYTLLRTGASTAMLTTYAEMYNTSSLASFTADVSGGLLRLLVTPASATSTVFSVVRTSLT